jgi:PAS domain S-box-containing protein
MLDFSAFTKEQLIELLRKMQSEISDLRSAPENQRLIHDLRVHQLELEMQNRELREAQTELELARDRYADLYDFAPVGYVTLDAKGRVLEINLNGANLLGKPRTEIVKLPFSSLLHPEDIAHYFSYLKQVLESDRKVSTEVRLKKGKQKYRYCYLESIAIHDARGNATTCRTAIIDISERKHAEEQLNLAHAELEQKVQDRTTELMQTNLALKKEIVQREQITARLRGSEERYRSVVESQTELICRWKPGGVLTFVNDAYCRAFGKSCEELIGHTFLPLIPEEDRDKVRDHIGTLSRDNPVTTLEHRVIVPSGEIRWQRWINHASFDEQGNITEFQSVGNDVTERRRVEHELNQYRAHLEVLVAERTADLQATNRELELFSYTIAHDLRAPLRAVTSFSQILLDDVDAKLNDEERDSLHRIIVAGKYMAQLIDDILKLAKVTRSEMHFEVVNISALCHEAAARLQQADPDRCVSWNIQDGLTAWGDRKALAVMLNNLAENAWKFTQHTTDATIEFGAAQEQGEQVFYVKDNGVGFDMQYASKLFRAFERLHSSGEFEGTGIGLATVLHVVDRHRGNVWARGTVGKGATIYFQLPASKEEFKNNSEFYTLPNRAMTPEMVSNTNRTEELANE